VRCRVIGWWLTLWRYGPTGPAVSGCDLGPPTYEVERFEPLLAAGASGARIDPERGLLAAALFSDGVRAVEWEHLTCRRCGRRSSAWRPMPVVN
jgi:hypothetical protein